MPSRMTGKQRAARIPLDYYKKPDRILWWKRALSLVALLGAGAWLASGFSFGGPGWISEGARARLRYSHGPVARAHAPWDAKCDACHAPFTSIRGERWPTSLGMRTGDAEGKCLSCHRVADHAANMKPNDEGSCASCHQDHRGRDGSLVRLDDAQCTSCHGALKDHVADASKLTGTDPEVTSFPGRHPEFALLRSQGQAVDPNNLKFNHALHMTPGLNEAKDGKPVLTLARLAPADRERYRASRDQKDDAAVALSCASCHRLGNGSQPDARPGAVASGDGAYFRPVAYATDCAACHRLDVALGGAGAVSIPHRVQPPALEAQLTNASIGVAMKEKDRPAKEPARPLPGRTPSVLASLPGDEEIASRVVRARRILFGPEKGTCTECHHYEAPDGARESLAPGADLSGVRIAPTSGGKPVWFENAWFDHSAHRGVSCRSCHEGAYPDAKSPSRVSSDVLLVGKATCVQCHAPEGSDATTGEPRGGAGHSCTECHRYHGGGHGGGTILDDSRARTIEAFLRGSVK